MISASFSLSVSVVQLQFPIDSKKFDKKEKKKIIYLRNYYFIENWLL